MSRVEPSAPPGMLVRVVEILGILALFALHGGWPAPDVNEPHYVLKARHFWQPDWLAGDFFLNSPDAHVGFYALLGWLAVIAPPAAAAWIGRLAGWALLAVGWQRLSWALIPRPGLSLVSALLWLAGQEWGSMAGEWVVGGFEAKPFSYGCVFLALAAIIERRWLASGFSFAGGLFLHVLVGGWALLAAGFSIVIQPQVRAGWQAMLPGLGVALFLGALPALGPALNLNAGADRETIREAGRIYVFERLSHHLVPDRFNLAAVERHALLVCLWIALIAFRPSTESWGLARGMVAGAIGISLAGWLIRGWSLLDPDSGTALLRWYWFRLGDVLVPLGVALEVTALMASPAGARSWMQRGVVGLGLLVGLAHAGWLIDARLGQRFPRSDKPGRVLDPQDWQEACAWIRRETPPAALFLVPRSSVSFKWHAERADTGTWKDIPQDARGLVAWWQRMDRMHATHAEPPESRWFESLAAAGTEHVTALAEQFRATHLLTSAEPPLPFPRLYGNASYAVYALPGPPPGR